MIKKLQLRGISRTPSYHLTADGGCSESLNVQLDDTEVSPILEPKVVEGLPDNVDYLYIHKFGSVENYVYLQSGDVYATTDGGAVRVADLGANESVVSVSSIGKTLIVYGTSETYYSVWKDGTYVVLGTRIPEPKVYLDTSSSTETIEDPVGPFDTIAGTDDENRLNWGKTTLLAPPSWWSKARIVHDTKGQYPDSETGGIAPGPIAFSRANQFNIDLIDAATDYVWGKIDEKVVANRESEYFTAPVFVRYAVKLYDESYIYQSVPLLVGNGKNQYAKVYAVAAAGTGTSQIAVVKFDITKIRSIADIKWEVGDWGDIVKSVDLFLSTDIENPKHGKLVWDVSYNATSQKNFTLFKDMKGMDEFKDVEGEILSKVNFYKVKSFGIEEFSNPSNSLTFTLKPYSQDELVVSETLPDDNLSNHQYGAAGGSISYNMRTILYGVKETLYPGYYFLQGEVDITDDPNAETVLRTWKYKYFVSNDNAETASVIGRNSVGGTELTNHLSFVQNKYTKPLGVLFYPDPNCKKVQVYDSKSGLTYSVPMKEHPGLNCSYALCSLDSEIISIGTAITDADFTSESPTLSSDNSIMMSEAYNPFVYGMLNRKSFGSKVVGVATVTKALSTGQFGQFPLYVFTEEGIQAIGINNDGSFGVTSFVSRDVAIEGTIAPIDQAIVFSSAQGVMLLVGSDIECISTWMNGRHEPIEEDVVSLLENTVWSDYVLDNDAPFMDFIKNAKAAYDYAGKRLIFFNPEHGYQYVYRFGSKSWHKMFLASPSIQFRNILNSYPECLVAMSGKVLDFSTYLDASLEDDTDPDNDQPVLPGIIETRAFGLDADDTYKVVRRIRIRGDYTKGRVKYVLLGSVDGREYRIIHSFRGPSWKSFKLVVVSMLRPTERISYVEIDYDVKFNDRIR
jgi:hypothetical protein